MRATQPSYSFLASAKTQEFLSHLAFSPESESRDNRVVTPSPPPSGRVERAADGPKLRSAA
jgi:hypothetical protein